MDPFIGEIRIFAGNYAPQYWAFCAGQVMPISQNTPLYALLGTTYGGDGISTFGLPNLIDRTPMHIGGAQPGPGLSTHSLGEMGGSQAVTLLASEIPAHTHAANCSTAPATSASPANAVWATGSGRRGAETYSSALSGGIPMPGTVAGSSLPHNNLPPFLGLTFIISLQGVFPSRG